MGQNASEPNLFVNLLTGAPNLSTKPYILSKPDSRSTESPDSNHNNLNLPALPPVRVLSHQLSCADDMALRLSYMRESGDLNQEKGDNRNITRCDEEGANPLPQWRRGVRFNSPTKLYTPRTRGARKQRVYSTEVKDTSSKWNQETFIRLQQQLCHNSVHAPLAMSQSSQKSDGYARACASINPRLS